MKNERMRTSLIIAALALVVLSALGVSAQTGANGSMETIEADRIVRAFTTKEAEFRRALNSYSFKRDALMQSIGMGGQVIGEYHRCRPSRLTTRATATRRSVFFRCRRCLK